MRFNILELPDELLDIALALALGLTFEIKLGKVFEESSGWFIPTKDGNLILKLMKENDLALGNYSGVYCCKSLKTDLICFGYTQHQAVIMTYLMLRDGRKIVDIPDWCLRELYEYKDRLEAEGGNFGETYEKLKSRVS